MAKFEYDIDSIKIEAGKTTLDKEISLDSSSYNVIATEIQGTGPRYGMSVFPGQYNTEIDQINLRSSEGTTSGYSNRKNVFGMIIERLQISGEVKPVPIFICSSQKSYIENDETKYYKTIDLIPPGKISTGMTADVGDNIIDSTEGSLDNKLKNWRLKTLVSRRLLASTAFLRFAQLSVGLADLPCQFQLVNILSDETSNNPGKLNFASFGYDYFMNKQSIKTMQIYTIFTDTGKKYFGRKFIYDNNTKSWTSPNSEADITTPHFTCSDANRTTDRLTTPTYTTGEMALQYSDDWKISQSHSILAMAHKTGALIAIMRSERDPDGFPFQYVDPQDERIQSIRTMSDTTTNSYMQNGNEKATGWSFFPDFDGTTPLTSEASSSYDGKIHIRLGATNSGLLRSNLIYELGYSIYDASINHECNVCIAGRVLTGSDDYVAFSIFRNEKVGGIFTQRIGYDLDVPVQKVPIEKVNYLQYRFYYRGLGSTEWLPAGVVWAADYLFNGTNQVLWCAQGAIGMSIGGIPGGFNDFSALPRDNWTDVAVFQNRFFWMSEKQAIFSLPNNCLAYPLRNSISLPAGGFRGITVHVFYGQSEQQGRVVLWSSEAQYEGRFTGNISLYPVTVSPDYTANFPLDGSDFIVQFRSKFTAFSSRAAVVAEGALFYWGEAGIFADGGVEPPRKISQDIEPWLDSVFDSGQISKIHCVYNESPKEIIWFYPPRVSIGFLTEALVFNAEKNSFQRIGFGTEIDWSSNLNITQEFARKRLMCGKRITLGHTHSFYPQRIVFCDLENKCGDLRHGREFLVKEIQSISTGSRLILASGFDIPSFADIPIGEQFLINQAFNYTENESNYDGRYTIIDIGPYYFDINESLPEATFTADKLMPIWIDMYSHIPFKLKTRYIMPKDRWQMFQVSVMAMYFRLLNDIVDNFDIGIFSNVSTKSQMQTVLLEKNANSHCIRRLTFPHDEDTTHGIGFGFECTGNANGACWRLDWLGIEGDDGEDLQRFEQS
jgi:hypothetical protein